MAAVVSAADAFSVVLEIADDDADEETVVVVKGNTTRWTVVINEGDFTVSL